MRITNSLWKSFLAAVLVSSSLGISTANADVRLPNVFTSHMVLQQEMPVTIWGWAQPNENVTVTLDSATATTQANERGEWKVTLPAMKAGGPFTLRISGVNTIELADVMIGEVWLCSGQSNMEMGIGNVHDAQKEIAEANEPGIRLLLVKHKWSPLLETNIDGGWKICSPQTVTEGGWSGFSAAAYFFGRELHRKLGVTVGLIESSWGGTRIESWTPPHGFASVPALRQEYDKVKLADPATSEHTQRLDTLLSQTEQWVADARKAEAEHAIVPAMPVYPNELLPPHDLQNATALYNGMAHPICPFTMRGAIWYQGESNLGDGSLYTDRMKALIAGWRAIWHEGDFPFYYVQIAPFNYGGNPEAEAEFWEAQAAAQSIPNTGMAVINDIGDLKDIHPKNKQRRRASSRAAGPGQNLRT